MQKIRLFNRGLVMVCAALFMLPISASALPVDAELALVIDVSGSIARDEFNLQMQGYVRSFRSAAVQQAIQEGSIGKIAVSTIFFDSTARVAVDWMLIEDEISAGAFADALESLTFNSGGNTDIAAGLQLATDQFNLDNGYEGTRNVIDVSGDGMQNASSYHQLTEFSFVKLKDYGVSETLLSPLRSLQGQQFRTVVDFWAALENALGMDMSIIMTTYPQELGYIFQLAQASELIDTRDYALSNEVDVINGLAITTDYPPLDTYYRDILIGGPGAFVMSVESFEDFEEAIDDKLIREISGTEVPEPSTMLLLGAGLIGLVTAGRKHAQRK